MKKYKNIIVAIDIYSQFYDVFEKAINIAKSENSSLYIVSAIPFTPDIDVVNTTIEIGVISNIRKGRDFDKILNERKLIINQYVNKAKKFGIKKVNMIVEIDNPKNLILMSINDFKNSLIILGSSTKTLFKRFMLGSTAKYIVTNAPCNVLVVKSHI